MQAVNMLMRKPAGVLLSSLALFFCVLGRPAARADVPGLYPTYLEYALANEWVEVEIDSSTGKTNLTWQSGYEPTDDKDGDGLLNREEFNGWKTTINGKSGWFTCNSTLLGSEHHFGWGSNPEAFDSDCDGISDLYERYAGTNPRSGDTDGDGLKDPVEIYAGLSPLDDGFIYDNSVDPPVKMEDDTGNPMRTLWHPDMDIDGDGLPTKKELKKANDISFGKDCPELGETGPHFPWEKLDGVVWTDPLDCDTDSDWLLDSFERTWKGFKPIEKEPVGDTFHYNSDADRDGLTNFREQCLHPLLAHGWGNPLATWPFGKSKFKDVAGEESFFVEKIGTRFGSDKGKNAGRILEGIPGYLQQAQFNMFDLMNPIQNRAFYYKNSYDTDGLASPVLAGLPGTIKWAGPKTYWTNPRPVIGAEDWDGDGLPDGWEVEHGLNPLSGIMDAEDDEDEEATTYTVFSGVGIDPSTALGDPDGDGLVNLQEYYGQDGYRIDLITGTGDETIPWVTRALNYPSQSTFENHLNENWILLRHDWQAPVGYDLLSGLDTIYDWVLFPGFFNPLMLGSNMTWWSEDPMTPGTLISNEVPVLIPAGGVPSYPSAANDMATLADYYGPDFPAIGGLGGFQPFATTYSGLHYIEPPGAEDGRYTPGVDNLWYSFNYPDYFTPTALSPLMQGDYILSDPDGELSAAEAAGTDYLAGRPITDNLPLMVPMPGWDSDSDGLPDAMEIQMDVARGKQPSSPVQSLNPMVARSAKIVDDTGSRSLFVDYPFYFSRSFTVEAWVYLDGDAPAQGSFIKGYMPWGASERKAYELGVTNVTLGGQVVSTVPFAGLHSLGGKWYQTSATRPLPRNRWVHLAATFSHTKNALSLYVDGTLVQSRQVVEETIGNYLLGNWGAGGTIAFGVGTGFAERLWIDELRIWGIERSSAEVADNRSVLQEGRQEVMLDGAARNGALLAYYNFDDGGNVAVDGRHRAFSSLLNYDYPAAKNVPNRLFHEYFYPDRAYALPTVDFGGGFVFDAGRTAPVHGALDSQRGELDSDGDGLPDSWEIVHEMNPFAWYTQPHVEASRYDRAWAKVAEAEVLIKRTSFFSFSSSADGGLTWTNATCPGVVSTVNGEVIIGLCPNTVLIGDYTTTTNSTTEDTNTTTTLNTVTNWEILSGQVSGFINEGETWWVSRGGIAVAQVGTTGKMLSDADGDPDGDGLSNLYEYWSRTNPRKPDTDENGIPDGDEDFDGDGLINRQEVRYASRPDLVDTDDDGMTDSAEVSAGTVASDSTSPKQSMVAYFNGQPGSWLEWHDRSSLSCSSWTLEAQVLPARVDFLADGHGAPIVRRGVEEVTNGYLVANYELRVVRSGANLYPEARFVYKDNRSNGVPFAVRGTTPLPVSAQFNATSVTHLAATYDGTGKTLTLFVNGSFAGSARDANISAPANGEGPSSILRIGERFHGFVDEVRLWSAAHDQSAIASTMSQVLEGQEDGLVSYFNFDDGGWPVLSSNTWANARVTNLLFSVRYTAKPADPDIRDGDTWVVGSQAYVNESGSAKLMSNVGPVFNGSAVVIGTGLAQPGDFGWSHAESILYKYNGTNWLRWGKGRHWLADARAIIQAVIPAVTNMTDFDPTPGDMFVCPNDGVVYIYNGMSEDGTVMELTADPLLDGHRFYLRATESIVEWRAGLAQLVLVAKAADEDGLYIQIQSEGMVYKSEDKIFRRWGYVPTTEDYAYVRDWESGWAHAAWMSGVVEFYQVGAAQGSYVPSGGKDSDGDGLPDSWEIRYGLNPQDGGFGGLAGGAGVDLDGDGQIDYVHVATDFINGAWGDPDNDGLNNRAEWLAGTNPFEFDTDGDGRGDYDSPPTGASYGSLYMDGDNIPDSWESLFPSACSPLRFDANLDPDGDGWDNYSEYMAYYLTHSATVYSVTTNEDGTVSSNWVSGTGYSVPYCRPDRAASYPKPQITFQFKTDCPEVEGTLRIWAYTDPAMNCPDAMTSIKLTAPIRDGNSMRITDWMDGGHLRQGKNYFMAFVDVNDDGQWNETEPLGFSEYMPENISWGEATISLALREQANGFFRAAWPADSGVSNATASYLVRVLLNNSVVYEVTRGGCSASRNYLHEFDFRNATGFYAAVGSTAMYGQYTWQVRNANNVLLATGTNSVTYPTSLVAPTILSPIGTINYAREKLRLTLDPATTQIQIQIRNASTGATILNTTNFAPYVDRQGIAELDLPMLAGWGALTNGQYQIQVRAFNPRASATSTSSSFTVELKPPAAGGAGMITGRAYYYGWASAAYTSIVVEAFTGSGFDQRPVAKVRPDSSYNFKLMGLPIGDYHVRAFLDQNGNGVLDVGEAWGLVKGAPASVQAINWRPVTITRRGGLSTATATSIYASDYSVKQIAMKSATELSGNHLVIHDADSDNDGLPDVWEKTYVQNLTAMNQFTDLDGDGLLDIREFQLGTNPTKADTDGDGLPDAWEANHGLNPLSGVGPDGAAGDPDGDGLSNAQELIRGTNPIVADTDGDGLSDGAEVNTHGTDPLNPDSDGDGLPDGWEVNYGLNPLLATGSHGAAGDPDGDGLSNAQELIRGTNPIVADTDGDGLSDGAEVNTHGTNPLLADSDNDGLSDGAEVNTHGTDPLRADTDGDGMGDGWEVLYGFDPMNASDAAGDADGDGLTNLQEFRAKTNPLLSDTDGDGLSDYFEVTYNNGNLDGDPNDYRPYPSGSDLNANSDDTDMDGYLDKEEYDRMIALDPYDPLNPNLPVENGMVSFTAAPHSTGSASMSVAYKVMSGAPADVVIEFTDDFNEWHEVSTTNVPQIGYYTNTVPAPADSAVKFFRIRYAP